jgi:hypothetical protein
MLTDIRIRNLTPSDMPFNGLVIHIDHYSRNLVEPIVYMLVAIGVKQTFIGKFQPGPHCSSQYHLLRYWLAAELFQKDHIQRKEQTYITTSKAKSIREHLITQEAISLLTSPTMNGATSSS